MTLRGLFIIIGLAALFLCALASCGCGVQTVKVIHEGGYKVDVHHDPQDVNLHKGWKKHRER